MANSNGEPPFLPYIVKQTDFLAKLALRYGFDAKEIWTHPKNKFTRELRGDPDVLCPGDLLFFPRGEVKPLPFKAGQVNKYVAKAAKIEVQLRFGDENGPWKKEPFQTEGLGTEIKGETGGNGEIVLTVPVFTETVIVCFPGREHKETVLIGRLDPINTLSGIGQRLEALGYYDAGVDDETGEAMALAILRFQEASNLEKTGRLDLATVQAILKTFGS
jgi:N-acetylmuramoyl-L-alanine amidase